MNARPANCVAAACLLLLSAAGLAQAGRAPVVAGNEKALWLAASGADAASFDLVCRPAGGKWQWVAKDRVGTPVAAAAVNGSLHLAFASGQCHVFALEAGAEGPALALPVTPLALCAGGGLELEDKKEAALLGLVPAPDLPAAASTPSNPPSTLPSAAAANPAAAQVLAYVPGEWRKLTTITDLPTDSLGRLRMVALDGALYLLIPGGDGRANRLTTWRKGQWSNVPLDQSLAGSTMLGMEVVAGRLVILAAASPSSGEVSLQVACWNTKTGEFTYQPIVFDGKAALWSPGDAPQVSVLADKLALLWRKDGTLKLATCNPSTGRLDPPEDVTIFRQPPPDDRGRGILMGLLWGIVAVILVLLFSVRPASTPKGTIVLEYLTVASLGRRLLATAVDLLPFNLAAGICVQATLSMSSTEAWQLLGDMMWNRGPVPVQMAYAWAGTILPYVAYCVVMEKLRGATLGKIVFKMRVVADSGARAGLRAILLRNLIKVIELSFPPLLLIGPLLDRHHQRLGDILARTTVVDSRPAAPPPPIGPDATPPQDQQGDQPPQD